MEPKNFHGNESEGKSPYSHRRESHCYTSIIKRERTSPSASRRQSGSITLEEHHTYLKKRDAEIRAEREGLPEEEQKKRLLLEKELTDITAKLADIEKSFEESKEPPKPHINETKLTNGRAVS